MKYLPVFFLITNCLSAMHGLEVNRYQKNPCNRKLILALKCAQNYGKFPKDLIPYIALYLIADNTENSQQQLGLLHHILFCQFSSKELVQAFKESPCYKLYYDFGKHCNNELSQCSDLPREMKTSDKSVRILEHIFAKPIRLIKNEFIIEDFDQHWQQLQAECVNESYWHFIIHYIFSHHSLSLHTGSKEVIKKIITDKFVDINQCDSNGQTILMRVVACCTDVPFITWLINHGADKTLFDRQGNSALHFACWEHNIELVKLLYDPAIAQSKNTLSISPWMAANASSEDRDEKVQFLRMHGAKF